MKATTRGAAPRTANMSSNINQVPWIASISLSILLYAVYHTALSFNFIHIACALAGAIAYLFMLSLQVSVRQEGTAALVGGAKKLATEFGGDGNQENSTSMDSSEAESALHHVTGPKAAAEAEAGMWVEEPLTPIDLKCSVESPLVVVPSTNPDRLATNKKKNKKRNTLSKSPSSTRASENSAATSEQEDIEGVPDIPKPVTTETATATPPLAAAEAPPSVDRPADDGTDRSLCHRPEHYRIRLIKAAVKAAEARAAAEDEEEEAGAGAAGAAEEAEEGEEDEEEGLGCAAIERELRKLKKKVREAQRLQQLTGDATFEKDKQAKIEKSKEYENMIPQLHRLLEKKSMEDTEEKHGLRQKGMAKPKAPPPPTEKAVLRPPPGLEDVERIPPTIPSAEQDTCHSHFDQGAVVGTEASCRHLDGPDHGVDEEYWQSQDCYWWGRDSYGEIGQPQEEDEDGFLVEECWWLWNEESFCVPVQEDLRCRGWVKYGCCARGPSCPWAHPRR